MGDEIILHIRILIRIRMTLKVWLSTLSTISATCSSGVWNDKIQKKKRGRKRSRKTKYLFFNKLTLELVGVLEALTVDLDGGAVSLSDVTQTLLLQLCDLWDLVFTTSTTRSADGHRLLDLRILLHITNRVYRNLKSVIIEVRCVQVTKCLADVLVWLNLIKLQVVLVCFYINILSICYNILWSVAVVCSVNKNVPGWLFYWNCIKTMNCVFLFNMIFSFSSSYNLHSRQLFPAKKLW